MSLRELYEKRDRLRTELDGLKLTYRDHPDDAGILERMGNVKTGLVRTEQEIVREAAADPAHREEGVHLPGSEPPQSREQGPHAADRDRALRAIEERADELPTEANDRLDDLVRRDRLGSEARYIAAVADPDYESAFLKTLAGAGGAAGMLNQREQEAMQRVGVAMTERAMQLGENKYGGYAAPYALDPTIILTSAGAVNPLRQVASVTTVTASEWKGISSAGVTAAFVKELTEVADGTPEIGQPTIKPEKAQSFVPFSIEAGEDLGNLQAELRRLFTDAKETLEAEKFTTGSGEDEPQGIVTGSTEAVETSEEAKLGVADLYSVQAALPPRFQGGASWLTSLAIANAIYRTVGGGSEEPPPFNEARDRLLMKPWRELSALDSKVETGKEVAIYGDIAAGFKVVDRVGMSVELIPHLLGENRRPIGARGLYAYWRTGSGVVNPAALRRLKVK